MKSAGTTLALIVGVAFLVLAAPARAQSEACCLGGGTCADLTAFVCSGGGGTPQGPGTMCLGDGNSNGIDDACEAGDTEACCYGEGECADVSPGECVGEIGGDPRGPGTFCLGDNNENGLDDACEGGTVAALWIGMTGNYGTASLWDINTVPCNGGGDTYEVTINSSGANVTFNDPTCGVDTLTLGADSALAVSGGATYSVSSAGTIHGTLSASGSSFTCDLTADIDEADLVVTNGVMSIGGATSYAHNANTDGDHRRFSADGATGILDLAAVVTITQAPVGDPTGAALRIEATNGGTVDLGGVATMTGGATRALASGSGSEINLSSLTSATVSNPASDPALEALGGGVILAGSLPGLNGFDVTFDGASTVSVPNLFRVENGTLDYDGGSFGTATTIVVADGSLLLGPSASPALTFEMRGTGTFAGNIAANVAVRVRGDSVGNAVISTSAGFTNSGSLTLGTDAPPQTATLNVTGGALGNLTSGTLAGEGTVGISGGPFNNSGIVAPGEIATGILQINGNYTQSVFGRLNVELGGTVPGTGYDQLGVSGTASLAGTLNVALTGGFDPPSGTAYTIVEGGTVTGTFGTANLPTLSAPRCLDLVYAADRVTILSTEIGIAQQPQSQDVCAGDQVTLSITPASVGDYQYQWRKGGVEIPNEDAATLSFDPITVGDAGSYDVVVTNECGSVISASATLTVSVAPSITLNPVGQNVCVGDPVTLMVDASGTAPLSYQWRRNGVNIPGANDATLMLDPTTLSDNGNYRCIVSNMCGVVPSGIAAVTVNPSPLGDFTDDCQIDGEDTQLFAQCLTGPGGGVLPGCDEADMDMDGDVDLADYGDYQFAVAAN